MKYTVRQLRACTRQIFNEVDAGKDVVIDRYGKQYRITTISTVIPTTPTKQGNIPLPTSTGRMAQVDEGLCSRHHVPLSLCIDKH